MRETVLCKIDTDITKRKYDPELVLSGRHVYSLPELDPLLQKLDCSQSLLQEIDCQLPS